MMDDEVTFWAKPATEYERAVAFWENLAIEYAADIEELEHRYDALIAAQAAEDELRDSAIFGEQQANRALRTELATLRTALAALRTELAAHRPVPAPQKYRYCTPSAIYPPRRCRRRVFQYHHSRLQRYKWIGGVVQREWANVLRAEGASLTHRELARLRAYADDWDATAEQMLNDSIPW